MWDDDVAGVYDLVYQARGKDYRAEAKEIADIVRGHNAAADSLLDVACGTGAHLAAMAELFGHVEGLELSEGMLGVARAKLPQVAIHAADMCTFALDRGFDAITCLFSSVGYLPSLDALNAAIGRMAAHLAPGGVLVVEPWWTPDRYVDGYVSSQLIQEDWGSIARLSRTRRENQRFVRMDLHFLHATADGIRHFQENHRIALFSQAEYLAAFDLAGCPATLVEDTSTYLGLYVAVKSG
ncbi:class I SAM-dependent DNA methyltransferase [Fodinicola acaciae]|uniref:class I SAM-dependent DNA methyltransferase n=1 Tax=Fodinicola acaciae TaxID=2681555 RepID=UPI0013D79BF1|nr:class I SAM-dependent methyltransferase [Fodinicola acaciae]